MPSEINPNRRRTVVAWGVVAAVCATLSLSFASVPLYRLFCQATGYGGTTQVAGTDSEVIGRRTLTVRFDANVAPGLPWSFEPETPSVSLQTGKTATVFFHVKNKTDHAIKASARYNVTPDVVGPYFDKIACFCFSEQKLGPHEELDMPVVFFLDPKLERDETMAAVDTVTLSYTFFAAGPSAAGRASADAVGSEPPKL